MPKCKACKPEERRYEIWHKTEKRTMNLAAGHFDKKFADDLLVLLNDAEDGSPWVLKPKGFQTSFADKLKEKEFEED